MQVHRARANGTTTGQRDIRLAITRQQRPQHQDGSAHGFHQFIWRKVIIDQTVVDLDLHTFINRDLCTHATKQFDRGSNIVQVGYVADGNRFGG